MKKRMISLLLTLVVVLGMVPMGALAAETPLNISLVEKTNFVAGKNAEFDFSVENTGGQAMTAYLMTALYAKTGNQMITCNYFKKEIEPKETLEWGTMVAVPPDGDCRLKVFAWDNMEKPDTISNELIVEMGEDDTPAEPIAYQQALKRANAYVSKMTPEIGTVGGEWAVLGLARNKRSQLSDNYISTYYEKVKQYSKQQETKKKPWSNKVTDVERVILALSSIGKDPADVGGVNLYDYIWNREAHMDHQALGQRQGVNELIFGLLALNSLPDVDQPEKASITRKQIIQKIYEYQTSDSGFSLEKKAQLLDADITAMALQALAPYYDTDSTVKLTVDAAVKALSQAQGQTGSFRSDYNGGEASESLAQVLVALSNLGINADTDARFIKNGTSILDALLTYYEAESGGFKHTLDGEVSVMGTEQALYALVAYDRFMNGETALYDMSDVEMDTEEPSQPEEDELDVQAVARKITSNEAFKTASEYAKKFVQDNDEYDADFVKQVEQHQDAYDAMDKVRSTIFDLKGKTTTKSELIALLNRMEATLAAFEAAIAKAPGEVPTGTVSLSIEKRIIGKGDTLPLTEVNLYEDDTVWDVFQRVCEKHEVSYQNTGKVQGDGTSGIYIQSIDGDSEFDHGSQSGWKFSVNGTFVDQGVSAYHLSSGDEIRIRYCLTVNSDELQNPLADYVKSTLLPEAEKKLNNSDKKYEESSKTALRTAVDKANQVIKDHPDNSTEDELAVSAVIGAIRSAYDQLKEIIEDGTPTNFENDLWLKYDFAEMKVGEKRYCQGRRLPEVIGWIPNFNFEIVSGDSVTIEPVKNEEKNSGYFGHTTGFNATAVKEGVTIIKVTYDEGTHAGKPYDASSPVNTAYVAYSVIDEEDEQIEIKDTIELDSYDTVYFTEDSAELDFDVTSTNATSVKVTCNGEELIAEDNHYTATLKNRANIIGMEATDEQGNTRCKYKVVDARKIKVKVQNLSRPNQPIAVNDEVKVSFVGITMPVYKLDTIYNPTSIAIGGAYDDDVVGTYVEYTYGEKTCKGVCDQYDLSTNNDFTIAFTESGKQTLSDGKIFCSWWGEELGQDKKWDAGGQENLDAPVYSGSFSSLPDITVDVKAGVLPQEITLTPSEKTLAYGETYNITPTYTPKDAVVRNATWTSSNPECISVSEDGTVTVQKPDTTAVITHTVEGGAEATCMVTASGVSADVVDNYIAKIPEQAEQDYSTVPAIEEAEMLFASLTDDEKATVEPDHKTKLDEAVAQLDSLRKMPPYAFFTQSGERIPFSHPGYTSSGNYPHYPVSVYTPTTDLVVKRYEVLNLMKILSPRNWPQIYPNGTDTLTLSIQDGQTIAFGLSTIHKPYDEITFNYSPRFTAEEVAEYVEANETFQSATKLMEAVTEEQKKLDEFAAFETTLAAVREAGAMRKHEVDALLTTLKEAYTAYNDNFVFAPSITQTAIEGGTKVTVTFPKIEIPTLQSTATSVKLIFNTNIPNVETISTENRLDNPEGLRAITFTVPDSFHENVELTEGRIEEITETCIGAPSPFGEIKKDIIQHDKGRFGTIVIDLSAQQSAE